MRESIGAKMYWGMVGVLAISFYDELTDNIPGQVPSQGLRAPR